jgi:predicted nucleic acid-binding protein
LRKIVSDTGPLLHLSEANSLDLLELAGQIFVPSSVAIEVKRYIPAWNSGLPTWIRIADLIEANLNEAQTWRESGILDLGEADSLALARQLHADWFLTDDTAARVMATSLGVEVHGSLGVLLWSARDLEYEEAQQRLNALAASSLWISSSVVAEARLALNRWFGRAKE